MYEFLTKTLVERGISRYALARKANITPSDLYAAFRGDRPFYPRWKARIAEALGMTVEELFEETHQ